MDRPERTSMMRRLIEVAGIVVSVAVVLLMMAGPPAGLADTPGADEEAMMGTSQETNENLKEAVFAGGCFWCIEAAFQLMPGVVDAVSGYTGGSTENPTYEQVSTGRTGHYEAVLVTYDPEQVSYEALLEQFWRSIDPTDDGGQFYDRGSHYYTAIFYLDEEQKLQAEASKQALEASGVFDEPIVTLILPAQPFFVAEDYHQDYFEKYLAQYKAYSKASGREDYLEETWGDSEDDGS